MSRNCLVNVTCTVVLAACCGAACLAQPLPPGSRDGRALSGLAATDDYHPTKLIVRSRPGADATAVDAALERSEVVRTVRVLSAVPGLRIVEAAPGKASEVVAALAVEPVVRYVARDRVIRNATSDRLANDPSFQRLWGMHNVGQDLTAFAGRPYVALPGYDINAPRAWDHWTGSADFRVAVLDTGIFYNHPDLAQNMWRNPGEVPGNRVDDDGNGYIDDVYGYDCVYDDGNPFPDAVTPWSAHGTHCAGTIGARGNNGLGVTGVNWQTQLVAVKMIDEFDNSSESIVLSAFQYCLDTGIRLSSNSWAWIGGGLSPAVSDMLEAAGAAGHLAVFAAGNRRWNNDELGYQRAAPAHYELRNIIAVSAASGTGGGAWWGNIGPMTGELVAPGEIILSTVQNGQYAYYDGTSMATPHVAGAAALIWSRFPALNMSQVRNILLHTARHEESLVGATKTHAMVDVGAAMAFILADCNGNGQPDGKDVSSGVSVDIDANGVPDECQTEDNNGNGVPDILDFANGLVGDCDDNGRIDTLDPDCNANGIADTCELREGTLADANANGIPDTCDIFGGRSTDVNGNGVPDETEPDDNGNQVPDDMDIAAGTSTDCNGNGVPDEADLERALLVRQRDNVRNVFVETYPACPALGAGAFDVWDDFSVTKTVTLSGGTAQVIMWRLGPFTPEPLPEFSVRIASGPGESVVAEGRGALEADRTTVSFNFPSSPHPSTLQPGTYWICVQVASRCAINDFGMWLHANVGTPSGSQYFVHTPTNWAGYGTVPRPGSSLLLHRPADVAFTLTFNNDEDADGTPDDCAGKLCHADWNADGLTNSTDVSDFVNAWYEDQLGGTLVTDWDANGVVNSADVSGFINSWFEDSAAGCG